VVTEYAFGHANLDIGQKLTPRHRAMQILRAFVTHGAPKRRVRDWTGRWWSPWGAFDLVPMGNIVMAANPHAFNPVLDATEIEVTGRDTGRVSLAGGYASHAETVRRTRNKAGTVTESGLPAAKERGKKPWWRRWNADTGHPNAARPLTIPGIF